MKQLILLLVFTATTSLVLAQNVTLAFNSLFSGRNVTAYYDIEQGDNTYSFGLGYNINKHALNDDQSNFFRKRLYAQNTVQHLNINFSYQRAIFKNATCIRPFAFYDVQGKYAHTRGDVSYLPSTQDQPTTTDGDGYIYSPVPFTWIEQNIGLGFTANITERIYLKQRLGIGVNLIVPDKSENQTYQGYSIWEFGSLLSFGVGMRLS